jgi:hypothetical protein
MDNFFKERRIAKNDSLIKFPMQGVDKSKDSLSEELGVVIVRGRPLSLRSCKHARVKVPATAFPR